MKKLLVILMASLIATSAFAVIDPDPSSIGIYFDETADVNCVDFSGGPLNIYVVWTTPLIPAFLGYEFGYFMDIEAGASIFMSQTLLFNGVTEGFDIFSGQTEVEGSHAVVCVDPVPTGPATIIHAWVYQIFSPGYMKCFIFQSETMGGTLPQVLGTEEDLHQLNQSTGGWDVPVATLNTSCVVDNEEASFGSVKSLFR